MLHTHAFLQFKIFLRKSVLALVGSAVFLSPISGHAQELIVPGVYTSTSTYASEIISAPTPALPNQVISMPAQPSAPATTSSPVASQPAVPPVTVQPLAVNFVYPPASISGNVTILVRTNRLAEKVYVKLLHVPTQTVKHEIAVFKSESSSYYFNYALNWLAATYPAGEYRLTAMAVANGSTAQSATVVVKVMHPALPATSTPIAYKPPIIATSTLAPTPVVVPDSYIPKIPTSTVVVQASTTTVIPTIKPVSATSSLPYIATTTPVKPYIATTTPVKPYIATTTPVIKPVATTTYAMPPKVATTSVNFEPILKPAGTDIPAKPAPVAAPTPIKAPVPAQPTAKPVAKPVIEVPTAKPENEMAVQPATPAKPAATAANNDREAPKPVKPVTADETNGKQSASYVAAACIAANILDPEDCQLHIAERERSMMRQSVVEKKLDNKCVALGINSAAECAHVFIEQQGASECRAHGQVVKSSCAKYLLDTYGHAMVCRSMSLESCEQYLFNGLLHDFMSPETVKKTDEQLQPLLGKSVEIKNDLVNAESGVTATKIVMEKKQGAEVLANSQVDQVLKVLPFAKANKSVPVTILPVSGNQGGKTAAGALIIDTDRDGLSDAAEKIIGTDPKKADTDGDGYDDRQELLHNYNPLSTSKQPVNVPETIKPLIAQVKIEQPQFAGVSSKTMRVNQVSQAAKEKPTFFAGKAEANAVVNLFVYSALPIIITVKADAQGNWRYDLDHKLSDGRHEAYVVINNKEGRIVEKSSPFSFFVKDAQAVTRDEFVRVDPASYQYDSNQQMQVWFLLAGILMMMVGICAFYLVRQLMKRHSENLYGGN